MFLLVNKLEGLFRFDARLLPVAPLGGLSFLFVLDFQLRLRLCFLGLLVQVGEVRVLRLLLSEGGAPAHRLSHYLPQVHRLVLVVLRPFPLQFQRR